MLRCGCLLFHFKIHKITFFAQKLLKWSLLLRAALGSQGNKGTEVSTYVYQHTCVASTITSISCQSTTVLQDSKTYSEHQVTQFVLGFILDLIHSEGLGKQTIVCSHYYCIMQNWF